ncbi:hypothetical protein R4Z10_12840 [Niallia sp. XMNu-256]|uniref:hypothetical protein n=1 Tax=Niallia sp. XMNu-256 TaxID=3082444 RepID=UPI0030CF87D3
MKKFKESFRSGLEMLANSMYGDINCKYKSEEEENKQMADSKKHNRRKSYGHLRVIK